MTTTSMTFTGLTKTHAKILSEANKLIGPDGLVCRGSLLKKIGLKKATLQQNLCTMRKAGNFPFKFRCNMGRRRQNITLKLKVPTIALPVNSESV